MKKMLLKSMLVAGALTVGMSAFAQEDVTSLYLTNADLTSLEGWSYGDDGYNYTDWRTDGDVPVIEFYHTWSSNAGAAIGNTRNFHFTQTVTLPAGDYRIAVNAFYREGNGNGTNNDKAWIFAGEKKQNIFGLSSAGVAAYSGSNDLYKAANAFSKGDFSNAFDFTLESEQEIELGFRGYIDTYCSWCILGPVKLFKYSLEDYLVDYRAKVAEAQPLTTKPMNNEVRQALKDAMVEESTLSTSAQVADAIQALTAAIAAANNSIAAYVRLFAALEDGAAFIEEAIANGAPTPSETVLDDIWTNYEEGLVADADIDAEIAKIDPILVAVARQQTKVGSDMTRLLVNPNYEQGEYGWTVEAAVGDGPEGRQGNVRPGGSADNLCYEAWNNANFDIYQEVPEAPVGVYEISVQGFYRYGRNNAWNDYLAQTVEYVKPAGVPVYIYLNNNPTNFTNIYGDPKQITDETFYSAGSTDWVAESKDGTTYYFPNGMASAAIAFSADMYTQSAFGLVAREGDQLRIGVKGNSNQLGDSWVIWDNFKLTFRGFDPEVIKPVLEAAAEDVDTLYMGLLMGKSEYAALTKALSDAQTAIANNDGEAMFNALNDLYDAKDPARISKDIFLEQEVAADTLRLAEAIRAIEGLKLANSTKAAADELLNGLLNNLIYENDEIGQLKQDVTDMIGRLNNSVALYSQLNSAINSLASIITEAENKEGFDADELIVEAKALKDGAAKQYDEASIDDDDVPAKIDEINEMIEKLRTAILTTGINAVSVNGTKADTYNVGGQRVDASAKGLYIVNGKKVTVK